VEIVAEQEQEFLARLYQYLGMDLIINSSVVVPDPHWECGYGSRSKGIDQNEQIILISSLSKMLLCLRRYVL
jgi:hypothetical protein